MKNKQTQTKLGSTLGLTRHLISGVLCLAVIILICSSAPGQNLFVSSDAGGGNIYEFTPNGVRSTFASGLAGALAFDKTGNLFVTADHIYKFTPRGVRTTFASSPGGWQWPAACDNAGNLFVSTGETDLYDYPINGSGKVYKFTATGARTTFASGLDFPTALAFDGAGNLFVANLHTVERDRTFNGAIYKFTPAGVRTTFASGLNGPEALAFDKAGNLFVSNASAIDKFTPGGVQSIFASGFIFAGSLACDSAGNLFVADSPPTPSIRLLRPEREAPSRPLKESIFSPLGPLGLRLREQQPGLWYSTVMATVTRTMCFRTPTPVKRRSGI